MPKLKLSMTHWDNTHILLVLAQRYLTTEGMSSKCQLHLTAAPLLKQPEVRFTYSSVKVKVFSFLFWQSRLTGGGTLAWYGQVQLQLRMSAVKSLHPVWLLGTVSPLLFGCGYKIRHLCVCSLLLILLQDLTTTMLISGKTAILHCNFIFPLLRKITTKVQRICMAPSLPEYA